ncbi:hypothetical protein [Streptomyces sp. NBC_00102]|uniref:hypothetical protein n=1 Tax=Streptomyces sp. NBC_00102 TaxID=2975652 RepID=UPI0022589FE1|nr:hypothetical protein [Streptomyces sp. NBC_00102]MCX5398970.1 hypothetical protein [Streptomyces sp. NBC_00102]
MVVAAVAGAFPLAQLLLVRPAMGLGWDESVYVSQVASHAPASFFSAPRARGVPLLVAPVAAWSSSTEPLRIYLAVLSGLGLFLALRAWRQVLPASVLATAGALFATLWVTLFYGPQAMPNYWVAVGALAGTGCFLRARAIRTDRTAPWGLGLSVALMAGMRPMDAVWVVLPLVVLVVCVRQWRRPALLVALGAGLAAGAAEWVVEAYVSYGGLAQRLSDASRIQGGLGWNVAVGDQLRALGGRTLCRPCTGAVPPVTETLWWFALPLLAALAVGAAVRAGRPAVTLVPLACAASAAFPYLFLIGYAAPRFLMPAYALLAVPVAGLVVHAVRVPGRLGRPLTVTLLVLVLAGHLTAQLVVLHNTVRRTTAARQEWADIADGLHRLGVRPPCLVTGKEYVPIAFYTGCSSAASGGHDANTTVAGIRRTAGRLPTAVLVAPAGGPPGYARSWPSHRVAGLRVYVAPAPAAKAPVAAR